MIDHTTENLVAAEAHFLAIERLLEGAKGANPHLTKQIKLAYRRLTRLEESVLCLATVQACTVGGETLEWYKTLG